MKEKVTEIKGGETNMGIGRKLIGVSLLTIPTIMTIYNMIQLCEGECTTSIGEFTIGILAWVSGAILILTFKDKE